MRTAGKLYAQSRAASKALGGTKVAGESAGGYLRRSGRGGQRSGGAKAFVNDSVRRECTLIITYIRHDWIVNCKCSTNKLLIEQNL